MVAPEYLVESFMALSIVKVATIVEAIAQELKINMRTVSLIMNLLIKLNSHRKYLLI